MVTLIPGDGELSKPGFFLIILFSRQTKGIGPEISQSVKDIYTAAKVMLSIPNNQ